MIKNFSIFKNLTKSNEKHPDYILTAKFNDLRGFEEVGAAWKKKTKPTDKFPEGREYLSVSLKDKYQLIIDQTQLGIESAPKDEDF